MSLLRGEIGKIGTALTAVVFAGLAVYEVMALPFGPYIVFMLIVHTAVVTDCVQRLLGRRAPLSEFLAKAYRR